MITEEIKAYCLSKLNAYEDYPFGDIPICYKLNKKVFAQIYPNKEDYKITLKCTADAGQFYRQVYPGVVVRGYHCPPVQQPYWNTIYLDHFPDEELLNMIDHAYDTVLHSFSKKVQKQILTEDIVGGLHMELHLADSPGKVAAIVEKTISSIYPHYYPFGAVQFFLALHSEHRVRMAMKDEEVYYAMVQDNIVGTGSIRRNEICRLFILPEYQGKGYGSRLMDLLEEKVFMRYPMVHIDASFPAESMYLKRGYQITSYEKIETENGDFLCYHIMEKRSK